MNMDFLAIIPAMIPNIAMPFKILTNFKTGIRMNEYATVGSLITIILNNEILRYNASITLFSLLLLKFIQYGVTYEKISQYPHILQSIIFSEYILYFTLYTNYDTLINTSIMMPLLRMFIMYEQFRLIIHVGISVFNSILIIWSKRYLKSATIEALFNLSPELIFNTITSAVMGKLIYINHNGTVISNMKGCVKISEEDLERYAPINNRTDPIPEQFGITECSICTDKYLPEIQLTRTLPCKHSFHCSCVDAWFFAGHLMCPMCRHPLVGN